MMVRLVTTYNWPHNIILAMRKMQASLKKRLYELLWTIKRVKSLAYCSISFLLHLFYFFHDIFFEVRFLIVKFHIEGLEKKKKTSSPPLLKFFLHLIPLMMIMMNCDDHDYICYDFPFHSCISQIGKICPWTLSCVAYPSLDNCQWHVRPENILVANLPYIF